MSLSEFKQQRLKYLSEKVKSGEYVPYRLYKEFMTLSAEGVNPYAPLMTKQQVDAFYCMLHEEIAKTVPLSFSQIRLIRDLVCGRKKDRRGAAEWIALQLPFLTSSSKQKSYQSALNFCASAADEDWRHVTLNIKI